MHLSGMHTEGQFHWMKVLDCSRCIFKKCRKVKKDGEVLHIEEERCYKDYETMALEEAKREDGIDFVVVVTPNASHYEICKAFLNAGIHVVCDKPVTTTYEKAVELQKLAEEKITVIHGYLYLYGTCDCKVCKRSDCFWCNWRCPCCYGRISAGMACI